MGGISGFGVSGPECAPARATFFSIQIWSPWYNAPATMMARQTYLMTCPGVMENTPALMAIMGQWGMVPWGS